MATNPMAPPPAMTMSFIITGALHEQVEPQDGDQPDGPAAGDDDELHHNGCPPARGSSPAGCTSQEYFKLSAGWPDNRRGWNCAPSGSMIAPAKGRQPSMVETGGASIFT